jgi:hypothetical protein
MKWTGQREHVKAVVPGIHHSCLRVGKAEGIIGHCVADLLGEATIFSGRQLARRLSCIFEGTPHQIMPIIVSMDKFTAVQTEYPVKYNFARDSGSITALIVVKMPGMMTHLRRKSFINVRDIKVLVLDKA